MVESTKQVELFLFINPISPASLKMEEEAFKFIDTYKQKSQITIFTYHNIYTLYSYMIKNQLAPESTALWNKLHNDSYHLSLAFIAATIQGKKKSRKFLLNIQRKMLNQKEPLSKSVLLDSAKKANLDIDMFLSDFHSPFVQKLFLSDQKISKSLGIIGTPSCLLVTTGEEKKATLIENFITAEDLYQMI